MNKRGHHTKTTFCTPARLLCLLLFVCLGHTGFAQNTKGDRPASQRESRFKTAPRKEKKGLRIFQKKRIGGDRAAPNHRPRARAKGGDRAGKPIRPVYSVKPPRNDQKAWKGDIAGRKIRGRNYSSEKRIVYPQSGPLVHNNSRKPRTKDRFIPDKAALARVRRFQRQPEQRESPGARGRVVPRSASRPFIKHKSINVYANFKRPKKKGERAQTTDLAGRRVRGRNFETPRPGVIAAPKPYRGRGKIGQDRAYKGPSGGYRSATRGSRAWTGDIAGRKIRHRNKSSKKYVEGIPFGSGKRRAVPKQARAGKALAAVRPGMRIPGMPGRMKMGGGFRNQGEGYSGAFKRGRALKGGGSISGRHWNNGGRAIATRVPRDNRIGGLVVKRRRNSGFGDQGVGFAGSIKARRPAKGGGSVSGKLWNNQGRPIPARIPARGANVNGIPVRVRPGHDFQDQGERYTGAIRARRPAKGGGSVSGKLWNNNEKPIAGRQPAGGEKAATFTGNVKAKPKGPSAEARKAAAFRGNHKISELLPTFQDQGERFTGYQRLSRLKKNYIQNKLADENSIKKRRPEKETYLVKGLQVKVKRREYVRNKNISEDAMLKLRTTDTDRAVARLQVKVKQYKYVRNPSSADEALKVREPGKAFAKINSYQGNIRMQKFQLFEKNRELHPDAKFVRTNKNNVKEERDAVTNFRLWWARLFKKQETQPGHLKEKGKKPRYDKGEQGMWYD